MFFFFFFFNDTATTEIYTLSLHDALPIWSGSTFPIHRAARRPHRATARGATRYCRARSEEHTSELQSRLHLVCRLLLEKKKPNTMSYTPLNSCSPGIKYTTHVGAATQLDT